MRQTRACKPPMFTIPSFLNMALRHKHLRLDQSKLDRARRLAGFRTEQETVERALDVLVAEQEIAQALRQAAGVGGVEDVFGRSR